METFEAQSLEEVCGEFIVETPSTFRSGLRRGLRDNKWRICEDFLYFIYRIDLEIECFSLLPATGYALGYIVGYLKEKFNYKQKP